ncbi:unnamed protein product, partial [Rotaria magnacalcarata]
MPWSFNYDDSRNKCTTMNNLILCSNNNEVLMVTIP